MNSGMAKARPPSDLADKFMLRLPDGLRERIAGVAKANGRSMNAEIVRTLENAYPHPIGKREVVKALETILGRIKSDPSSDLSWHLKILMPELVETVQAGAILDTDVVETETISNP